MVICRLFKAECFKRPGFERKAYLCFYTCKSKSVGSKIFTIIQTGFVIRYFFIDNFCNYCPPDLEQSHLTALQARAVWANKDFTHCLFQLKYVSPRLQGCDLVFHKSWIVLFSQLPQHIKCPLKGHNHLSSSISPWS